MNAKDLREYVNNANNYATIGNEFIDNNKKNSKQDIDKDGF